MRPCKSRTVSSAAVHGLRTGPFVHSGTRLARPFRKDRGMSTVTHAKDVEIVLKADEVRLTTPCNHGKGAGNDYASASDAPANAANAISNHYKDSVGKASMPHWSKQLTNNQQVPVTRADQEA